MSKINYNCSYLITFDETQYLVSTKKNKVHIIVLLIIKLCHSCYKMQITFHRNKYYFGLLAILLSDFSFFSLGTFS